jgi:hypothetical protein
MDSSPWGMLGISRENRVLTRRRAWSQTGMRRWQREHCPQGAVF